MKSLLITLLSLALAAAFTPAAAAPTPAAAPDAEAGPARRALTGVQLGSLPLYSRLVFSFNRPVGEYTVHRADVDELTVDFPPAALEKQGRLQIENEMVEGVALVRAGEGVQARIKIRPTRFTFRHFSGPDERTVVIDLRPERRAEADGKMAGVKLTLPSVKELAAQIQKELNLKTDPPAIDLTQPQTEAALMSVGAAAAAAGRYDRAAEVLTALKDAYPTTDYKPLAMFLLGEVHMVADPDDFFNHFMDATANLDQFALNYPESPYAPRASLDRALAYKRVEYRNEAVKYLKQLITDYPQTREAVIGKVHLAELYAALGNRELAKSTLDEVLVLRPQGDLFLQAYHALGREFFEEGLFSQSSEIFREILDLAPSFYQTRPDILYKLGEGYYHLKRPDLSRSFLYHFLNLAPEHEEADQAMARIGYTYQEEGRHSEAIKAFTLTRNDYPGSVGALVSQMQLADYGALRSIFPSGTVFERLEEGTQAATLDMYREVAAADEGSPLSQLAMLRIGSAAMSMGDYPAAIEAFREILEKHPKGPLTEDVELVLNEALRLEVRDLYEQGRYADVVQLHSDFESLISFETRPIMLHYLAASYLGLDMPAEAVETWTTAEVDFSEFRSDRLLGLGRAYLALGAYDEAAEHLQRFRQRFPGHREVVDALVDQAKAELALGREALALAHLERALARAPRLEKDGRILSVMGQIYLKNGRYEKAVQAMKKSIAILGEQPGAREDLFLTYSRLGQAYARIGLQEKAASALDAAVEGRPEEPFPSALYLIGMTYRDLGRDEKYKEVMEIVMKSPDGFWKEAARRELEAPEVQKEVDEYYTQAARLAE